MTKNALNKINCNVKGSIKMTSYCTINNNGSQKV